MTTSSELDRRGVACGVGAHVMWGLFPAFWPLLDPASPIEVLAHRIVWTLVLMAVVLALVGGWRELRSLGARGWAMVTAAAVLIACPPVLSRRCRCCSTGPRPAAPRSRRSAR